MQTFYLLLINTELGMASKKEIASIDLKWVVILTILKIGEPDLLDAIIQWIMK